MSGSDAKTIIITGAGGGIGCATARRFSQEGWNIALVGRRVESLQAAAQQLPNENLICSCDVADYDAVHAMVETVLNRFDRLDALVNAAGVNLAQRSWQSVTADDFQELLSINIGGVFNCIKNCMEHLRRRKGTIVTINSEAGRRATAKAGAAYVTSKFAIAGMVESFNAEERLNGMRAVSIFPGEVNTRLLDQRPEPPSEALRAKMLQADDIAECVWTAVNLPSTALIEELVIRPTHTDYQ